MIKTSKTGVYYNLLEDGEKVFYFTYNDINDNKKKKWVQKTLTFEHRFQKHLNSVYTFI